MSHGKLNGLPRVDHVGSLIRPPELMQAMQDWEAGNFSIERLEKLQDQHIVDAVRRQEALGLPFTTDGEFRRRSWQRGFMDAVEGFVTKPAAYTFRNDHGVQNPAPACFAATKLRRKKPIVTNDFAFLANLTSSLPKATMPSPTIFHFGLFSDCVDRDVYPDIEEFFQDLIAIYADEMAALSRAGCKYLQFDEVPLALLCDPTNQLIAARAGQAFTDLLDLYIRLDNAVLAHRPADMVISMHLCRGNQAGLWAGDGGYDAIAQRLFSEIDVDAYLLEYDSDRAGDFTPLRYLPAGKRALLGLVSTKNPEIESKETLMRRLEAASKEVSLAQLGICPQCGFASSISRWNVTQNPMTADIQWRKLATIVEVARSVWS